MQFQTTKDLFKYNTGTFLCFLNTKAQKHYFKLLLFFQLLALQLTATVVLSLQVVFQPI